MPTLTITKRRTGSGETRYAVRYRLGGRAYPVKHAGSFRTLKEAKARRDLVGGLIAAGRNPGEVLSALRVEPPAPTTFGQAAVSYRRSRVDVAPRTATALDVHIRHLDRTFAAIPVESITADEIQEWIASSGAKSSTLRVYLSTLRRILDHAGIEPNPARSPRIRLPRSQRVEMEPPSASDVRSMVAEIAPRFRLALTTLAETGMRVGEMVALDWRDVDAARGRFRIRSGKTRTARRWVPLPDALLADILAVTPPDHRNGPVSPTSASRACAPR